nr:hypothetical protein 1634Bnrm2_p085 [Cryptomonas sp.]
MYLFINSSLKYLNLYKNTHSYDQIQCYLLKRNKRKLNLHFSHSLEIGKPKINNSMTPYYTISLLKKLKGFISATLDMNILSKYIQGNFDNYSQSHSFFEINKYFFEFPILEHIHCNIIRISRSWDGKIFLVATYYFPGIEIKFFRVRYYCLHPSDFSSPTNSIILMEIFRVVPPKNQNLFQYNSILRNIEHFNVYTAIKFNHCTVFWSKIRSFNFQKKLCLTFRGHLYQGGCSIYSIISEYFLHINDDLVLTNTDLLVNDRGFDEELFLVYGNNREIFFHLERTKGGIWLDWVFL